MTTPNTTGPSDEARELADSLFINGSGDKAERLVLWQDTTQRDLGGWCRLAVADRIDAALSRARDEARMDARMEALEDTLRSCRAVKDKFNTEVRVADEYGELFREEAIEAVGDCIDAIRAIIPAPQGETKEQQP